jgi:hypothetical protein
MDDKDEADLSVRGAHEAHEAIALARPQTPRGPPISVHRLKACRHWSSGLTRRTNSRGMPRRDSAESTGAIWRTRATLPTEGGLERASDSLGPRGQPGHSGSLLASRWVRLPGRAARLCLSQKGNLPAAARDKESSFGSRPSTRPTGAAGWMPLWTV